MSFRVQWSNFILTRSSALYVTLCLLQPCISGGLQLIIASNKPQLCFYSTEPQN